MARPLRRLVLVCGTLAGVLAASAGAYGQPVYRYIDADGRVVYSDKPPPAGSTGVETKRLAPNLIETDQLSLEARKAQERFPVTLYTFACGEVCDRAEALLERRGVPYTKVNVELADGAAKLKKLTGDLQAPVIQAGDKLMVRGFSETQWEALLDEAGYPKTPPLRRPPPREEPAKNEAAATPEPAGGATPGGYPKY
jgi:glutaredoxin